MEYPSKAAVPRQHASDNLGDDQKVPIMIITKEQEEKAPCDRDSGDESDYDNDEGSDSEVDQEEDEAAYDGAVGDSSKAKSVPKVWRDTGVEVPFIHADYAEFETALHSEDLASALQGTVSIRKLLCDRKSDT
jgi:hypothetical protein